MSEEMGDARDGGCFWNGNVLQIRDVTLLRKSENNSLFPRI